VTDAEILARVRSAYGLPGEFILFLGSLEPRKNLVRLISAYARLPHALRREVHLVIAGGAGWLNENVKRAAIEHGVTDWVHFVGYIPDEDLSALYSLATVFAYPSLAEGFGLPILDAMQCGVPVLTSNVSSLPEVTGDAAVLVSPTNVDEIVDGLTRLLESDSLRAQLRERGYRRASQFSWERCARETLAVYQQIYSR
jgi:glycosyltransferase involved in cell wall biosynthesis